jgi:hypothetical protein
MKTRVVKLESGESFTVPQGIQRLDGKSTHGWQVRYHGTKYFADGSVGPKKALEAATKELMSRIATMPAPVTLRRKPSPSKSSNLPVGISGPTVVTRAGTNNQSAVLQVLIPRFGQNPSVKSIYIGTPNTYTKTRFRAALAKAIELRQQVLQEYEEQATRAKRKAALAMRKELRAAAR